MKKLVLAIMLCCLSFVVQANTLEVDRAACKLLATHQPLPDVAYNPAVDVRGNPVVAADLNPSPTVGDAFTIPLTLDIGQQFGIPMGVMTGTRATIAKITVDGDKAYLDGQPLTNEQQENLAVLCIENPS